MNQPISMTNEELDQAIKTTDGLRMRTGSKTEFGKEVSSHLTTLLAEQKHRALAKTSSPEPATE